MTKVRAPGRTVAGWIGASLLLTTTVVCSTSRPPTPSVHQEDHSLGLPEPADICAWGAQQFVNWDPHVLAQIEGKELPTCNRGCGPQPPDQYGCNTSECRFYFSRCKENPLLGDLSEWAARIETINGMIAGEDKSGKGTVVHQLAKRMWEALYAWCTARNLAYAASHPDEYFSIPPNRQIVRGSTFATHPEYAARMCTSWDTIVQSAQVSGIALQGITQCLLPAYKFVDELIRVLEDQWKHGGGCYGYLNQEWWVEVGRLTCQLVNVLNQCRTTEALSTALKPVNTFINKNPILQTLIWGCDTFTNCQQSILCDNLEKACKFQAHVASRPVDCMTSQQNYSCDLHCCCRKNGVWSVGPEHQCLEQGGFMRPGTCGYADPATRAAWHLPNSPDECAQFNDDPAAWGPVGDPALRCVAQCGCPDLPEAPPAGFTCQAGTCPAKVGAPCETPVPTAMLEGGPGLAAVAPRCDHDRLDGGARGEPVWTCVPPPCQLFADGTGQQDCASCGDWCSEEYIDDYCGNGTCGEEEDSATCADDCPPIPTDYCGDGDCGDGEDAASCEADCGEAPAEDVCGDQFCGMTEQAAGCAADCPDVPDLDVCGDGLCTEPPAECPDDCTVPPHCGDGVCDPGAAEDAFCTADCPGAGT
jgi:hypothetical protein